MPTGIVKYYNEAKGFGFILRDDGKDDMFVHISRVKDQNVEVLVKGQHVQFDERTNERTGKTEAGDVVLLSAGPAG